MTAPLGGQQPATVQEVSMGEGGVVASADIGVAAESAVEAAVSQREQEGRPAGL